MNTKIIVANWKMNQSLKQIDTFLEHIAPMIDNFDCEAWIAPQNIHLSYLVESAKKLELKKLKVGAQNCHEKDSGAFTGETSSLSLKELGCSFTLVGHSERRSLYKESDALLNLKLQNNLKNNLLTLFCIGETLQERESNKTNEVLSQQLLQGLKGLKHDQSERLVLAYEPVWAIGTGKTATPEQANDAHKHIKKVLKESFGIDKVTVLYGGSVKPANLDELLQLDSIDGGLVGGASLNSEDYISLCDIASKYCK